MKNLRIVFLGTPPFVDPVLKTLKDNFSNVLEIRDPKELDDKKIAELKDFPPDLFVVASFGKILSPEVLEIPRLGSINIHPSLLPKYRGPTPVQTAVLNGDKTTGLSIIKIDEKVDHGSILYQEEVKIKEDETAQELLVRLFKESADVLPQTISNYVSNETMLSEQDHTKATFTKMLKKEDGYIDVANPPDKDKLDRMIRAFVDWPGVWTKYPLSNKGEQIIKILPDEKIQVEGKNPMTYKDFINGYEKGGELLKKIGLG